MRFLAVGLPLSLLLVAGCGGEGGDQPATGQPTIEEAAWIAAGVDRPDYQRGIGAEGAALLARIDTSLPVDDTDDGGRGFADRAAQIVWRTYAGPFDVIEVTVLHNGVEVVTAEYRRGDLETRLGPRPEGLDDGVARTEVAPATDGPFAGIESAPIVGDVQAEVFEPIIMRTIEEFFERTDATVDHGQTEKCLGGLTGDEPTGEFQATSEAVMPTTGSALAVLPALTDYWRGLGLDVITAVFDEGLNNVQVHFDGLGVLSARATVRGVVFRGHTSCLDLE